MPGVLHVVDRERAGDLHLLAERERAGDDLLRQLVGAERRHRDRAEAEPLRAPAASGRSAARIGRSAFVDEPTRTSSRGARLATGRLVHRASFLASSMQSVVHGNRLEPLERNLLAADGAGAVRARFDPLRARPRPRAAAPARPPRGPRRARARRSRWPCRRGGCRCSRTRARRSRRSWSRRRCS